MIPALITADWLRSWGACEEQVIVFERLFPAGASLTEAALEQALAARLDVAWLAELFTVYATAEPRRAYEAATAEAWRAYLAARATAEARRVFDAASAEPRRVYQLACGRLLIEQASSR